MHAKLASLILVAALVGPSVLAAAPTTVTFEAGIDAVADELRDRYPDRFVDVGVAYEPTRHAAVLFDGPVPGDLPDLHPDLVTRGYDISSTEPLTHGPLMPVMLATAQEIPDGIRPGAWLVEPKACTLAHIVQDGAGDLYALTAGHCVDTEAPDFQDIGRTVKIVTDAGPTGHTELAIGEVVEFENRGVGDDYALIAIDEAVRDRVEPTTAGWLGPEGVATDSQATTVHHYGFGSGGTWVHDATRCRTGATLGFWGQESYAFFGLIAFGDSGSPSQTGDGAALGINTHLTLVPVLGNNLGTRTTEALSELEAETGLTLDVVDGAPQAATCQAV